MEPTVHPPPSTAAEDAARQADEARAARERQLATPRIARELQTIAAMMRIHCRDNHPPAGRDASGLCPDCARLFDYARKRLALCTYGADKPTCVKCPIHCYGRKPREEVRQVMRYAGPRMLWRHPWLAIAHVIDGKRPAPTRPNDRAAASAAAGADAEPPG